MKKALICALVLAVGLGFAMNAFSVESKAKTPGTPSEMTGTVESKVTEKTTGKAMEGLKKELEKTETFTYLRKDATHAFFKDNAGNEKKLLLGEYKINWPSNIKENSKVTITYNPETNLLLKIK